MNRRRFLLILGGFALGGGLLARRARAATAASLGPATRAAAPARAQVAAPAVVVPLADLAAGDRVDGAVIAAVRPLERGAIPVEVLTDRGRLFRIEVLARDPSGASPAPVAETPTLALYVVNGGHGDRSTPPDVAEAARALAARLAEREAAGHTLPALPRFAVRPSA